MNILVVDDHRSARRVLGSILRQWNDVTIYEAASKEEAQKVLETHALDIAFIDIRLDTDSRNRDGLTLVSEIKEKTTVVPIVVTVSNEMAEIRAAMRLGAYDYILKDDLCEELVIPVLEGLQSRQKLEQEVMSLRARCLQSPFPKFLIGTSPPMEQLRKVISRLALSDRPVLVTGPTGAGKELVVRAIHMLGANPSQPILDLNCGAIPVTLIESQLFGHVRGAFTGALQKQEGYFLAVRRGTLFLDEIAELPLELQSKLLRVLETKQFRAVGSTIESRFEGRIISATHVDLKERVKKGLFREDLYYRLNVLCVKVPSLDERKEDIPSLVTHFLSEQSRSLQFSDQALEFLCQKAWPGNIRQLRNIIDRVSVFVEQDFVTIESLQEILSYNEETPQEESSLSLIVQSILRMPFDNKLEKVQETLLGEALKISKGNKSAAARLLGVHRKVVERRLGKHTP